jgi:serine phosphatase RsbU (regulator of sigma subunit)
LKKLIYILFLFLPFVGLTQKYADKDYYLVDSLNLDELSNSDKEIIESSLKIFHQAKNDTSRINSLNEICKSLMHEDWIKYQYYQHQLIEKALKENLSEKELLSLKKSLAHSLNNIGFVSQNKGKVKEALEYFSKSLKIWEEIDNKYGIAYSFNNIGYVYQNQNQNKEALKCYLKSLKLREEIGDKYGMAYSLNNVGVVYQRENEIEKALECFFKSLKIREELGDKFGIAYSLNNIGAIYQKEGEDSEALEYFFKSLEIREEIGDKQGLAESLCNIGLIYQTQDKDNKALTYLLRSLEISKEIGFPEYIEKASLGLSKSFEKQGEFNEALNMYKLHVQMMDSINNESNQKAAIQQQAKYEYEKQKALDDAEHEKQLAIEQEAKEKQKIITYSTAGGLALVALFLVFVFNRLQVTKKQKIVIQEAHYELEEKNNEILDSIAYAKRIQTAILPPSKLVKEYLSNSFILYKPKDIVAGDFYWMEHKDGKVLFAAADCTGHGVPGAMVSVICNNGLNRSVREYNLTEPGKILDKTREIVIQEFEKSEDEVKDGMDIALCSLHNNTLQYAGANNPLWIIRNNTNEIEEIKATKQPIGKYGNPEPYITHTIELQKGDSIYIFSDGYADQFGGEKGKKFKAANFKKLLLSIQQESMERQKELINEAFENWRGKLEQIDDVCVIGVKV